MENVIDLNLIPGKDGDQRVDGKLIGSADSSRTHHNHPGEFVGEDPTTGRRGHCSTCRFTEVRIFKTDMGYAVATMGHTIVPGEVTFSHLRYMKSPHEVIETLTTRNPGKEPYLSRSAARALAQAANEDQALENAYVDRAVA